MFPKMTVLSFETVGLPNWITGANACESHNYFPRFDIPGGAFLKNYSYFHNEVANFGQVSTKIYWNMSTI